MKDERKIGLTFTYGIMTEMHKIDEKNVKVGDFTKARDWEKECKIAQNVLL